MKKRTILWLAPFLLVSGSLFAAPKMTARLSSNRISTAETVLLLVEIEWSRTEASYGFVVPEPSLDNLSLIRRGESQELFSVKGEERQRKTFELELKPYGPGTAAIRAFPITYVDQTTQSQGSFEVTEMSLSILKEPGTEKPIFVYAGGGAIVVLVLFLASSVFRLLKKKAALPQPENLSEEAKASHKIRSLVESSTPSKDNFQQIASEFRLFLSAHFKTALPRNSEDELIRALKTPDLSFEEYQKIKNLLEKIQEAKYLPEASAAGDYKYLQREILSYVESKKALESFSSN